MKKYFAVAILLGVMACQAPEQDKVVNYNSLPNLPADTVAWSSLTSVTPYAAALLREAYLDAAIPDDIREMMVAQILQEDIQRMKDYRRSTQTRAPIDGYITGGCDCGGTFTCEFVCIGGKKILVTGVPLCCKCYTSLSHTGGVIECGNSGCESKSVSCSSTR